MSDDAVSASARGATFLILLQMSSRALTFALNQILLRFLSPQLLGVSVQLELYVISTLYFSRESLRIATQRRSDGGVQAAINLSYLAILAGGPIGLLFAQMYLRGNLPDVPYLQLALRINEVAAMIELFSEPGFVVVGQHMLYKVRASAEAAAVVMKTLATAGLVFWSRYQGVEVGVLPFAAGELAYSSSLAVVYLWNTASFTRQNKLSLLPSRMTSSPDYIFSLFFKPLLSLSFSLYIQSGIKYVLTQGDSLLIAWLATLEDQGMYALSANYGGLVARMLFRPIEDSSRNLFAKLCASTDDKGAKPEDGKKSYQQAAVILKDILHIYSIGSLVAFALGPTAAPLLLRLVAGARWADTGAGEVLGTYCYYIPLLAINGVSEAFVAATASTLELRHQSLWMGAFFAGFAGSAWYFLAVLGMGAKGLVLANCVNMALRILFNLSFVTSFFSKHGVTFNIGDLLPTPGAIAIAAIIPTLLPRVTASLSMYGLLGDLVAIGGIGVVFALVLLVLEQTFLLDCYRRFKS
ncbi:hypothetical protein AMS68_000423 [Peltaster fructicola]|uniref:Man(5)GlcNAc(2)-PP-dolichol translocation protein RFT1 n=1 Tax=Peltaster fructicola TaxID=286661 RepID=A0A6H0XJL5_9PEZI|nr:hypothetical protein AMS68_000423 [Peltaster fructicola]